MLPEANKRKPLSGVDHKNIKCLSVSCLEVEGIIISSLTSVYSQRPRFLPFFCFITIRKLAFIFHLVPAGCEIAPSYPHRLQNPKQGQREGIKRAFPFRRPCLLSREIVFSRKPIRSSFMSNYLGLGHIYHSCGLTASPNHCIITPRRLWHTLGAQWISVDQNKCSMAFILFVK